VRPKTHRRKILLSVWWDKYGVVHFELLPPNRTITAEYYVGQLERLNQAIREKRPWLINQNRIYLQHDNSKPHTSKIISTKIKEFGWKKIDHPPYSPDIAPSDYYLFRSMSHYLKDKSFSTREEIEMSLLDYFSSKSQDFYKNGIEKLIERWKTVIDTNGEYIVD
jgi:[histone H3]-lysine36 N-dimethyltransferase SETMAR